MPHTGKSQTMPAFLSRLRMTPVTQHVFWIAFILWGSPTLNLRGSDLEFAIKGPLPVREAPVAAFALDFNDDGHLDVAVTHLNSGALSLLLGDGTGGLSEFRAWYVSGLPLSIVELMVIDFNNDGADDLVVGAEGHTKILSGIHAHGFTSQIYSCGAGPGVHYPAVAEFNEDGVLDLAYTRSISAPSSVVLRPGGIWFPLESIGTPVGDGPTELFAVDLNGDSHLDYLLGHQGGTPPEGFVGLLRGSGMGSFGPEELLALGYAGSLARADFNGDGSIDLAVVGTDGGGPNVVRVFLGDGSGGLTLAQSLSGTSDPVSVRAADLDGDQIIDLLVADADGSTPTPSPVERLLVYQGDRAGVFSGPLVFRGFQYTRENPALGDFDGDGLLDIVAVDADLLEGQIIVHLTSLFRRGDADASGDVNPLADAFFLLRFEFVPGSPPPPCLDSADVDDNGSVMGLIDGIYMLNQQFVPGSPPPPAPGPSFCGFDPTPDGLICSSYPKCP